MNSIAISSNHTALATLVDAVSELSAVVLELSPLRVLAYRGSIPLAAFGAQVVVETRDCDYELAVIAEPPACRLLHKALLGAIDARAPASQRARLDEEAKSDPEARAMRRTREALCLLAEVAADAFARRLARHQVTLRRPIFVENFAKLLGAGDVHAAEVALGEVRLSLVVSTCGRSAQRPDKELPFVAVVR